MSEIVFDTSQLDKLAADLGRGTAKTVTLGRKALQVTAMKVKQDAQANAKAIDQRAARHYPATISYDLMGLRADIGPELGGQGSLGGILEEGTAKNRGQNNLTRALEANVDDFVKGATLAAVNGLL